MIPHALTGLTFVERFYTYPEVASTNEVARTMHHRPQKGIFCIQADQQMEGKGRRGTPYFSMTTDGLWVSLAIVVSDINDHFRYNRALSLAIVATLDQCGIQLPIAIKWPNDIYWGEKKICGILLENHQLYPDVLIAGFGINVNIRQEDFPPELASIATSIYIETGRSCSLSVFLRSILKQYEINSNADQAKMHNEYVSRLFGKGKTVAINGLKGVYTSVEVDGRLKLLNDGTPLFVSSGSPVFV